MRRIKIMLIAIAVFAVAGGAMAFKANSPNVIYQLDQEGKCVQILIGNYVVSTTTFSGAQSITNATYLIPQTDAACNTTVYYALEP